MKKLNLKLTTIIISVIMLSSCSNRTEFFIAKNGSDDNSGSIEKPFATLEKARDVIREKIAKKELAEIGYKVWLREGNYERKKVFELNEKDNGTKNATIVYSAYQNEEVRISGGTELDNSLAEKISNPAIKERIINNKAIDNIYQIDLKKAGITDYGEHKPHGFRRAYVTSALELFINDEAMHLARWPNNHSLPLGAIIDSGSGVLTTEAAYENRGGIFTYDYERPEFWKQANDIWLTGLFSYGFADDRIKVKHIDTEKKTINLAFSDMFKLRTGLEIHKYYALNLLEEIDTVGEYFVDPKKGILYFYYDEDIANANISVSMMEEPIIAMESVSNNSFQNIIFENSRGIGIYMEKGNNNLITDCIIRNMGVVAVCIGRGIEASEHYFYLSHNGKNSSYLNLLPVQRKLGSWHEYVYEDVLFDREGGKNHGVVNCEIYNCGAGGISMGGGNRKRLEPAGNYVSNCKIYNVNRLDRSYRAGINIDGVGNRIEHCEIFDCAGSAIYLHGNDHIMEYNHIHHVLLEAEDMGAIYYGRDPSERGNIVRHNFFHHINNSIRRSAIYCDDGSCGMLIEGNVFYKTGLRTIIFGGGMDHKIINNIFVDNTKVLFVGSYILNKRDWYLAEEGIFTYRLNYVGYNKPPYSTKYPKLANYFERKPEICKDNLMKNNVVWGYKEYIMKLGEQLDSWGAEENNFIAEENPGFVDAENMDFNLKESSVVFKEIPDFKKIPFDKIGLKP